MTDDTKQLYQKLDRMPNDAAYEYARSNNLDWPAYCRHREERKALIEAPSKRRVRAALLKMQSGCCALCQTSIRHGERAVRDRTGRIVCAACNLYLVGWRTTRGKGITEQATVEFSRPLLSDVVD
ncbi:MAG: hypothetical protein CEE38_17355 [Planctomycetes bacterium B3_Pla]|nr:MAG: hypothetical protein CEE38_17355 [Planctomycetes bacterium B3_Pla]